MAGTFRRKVSFTAGELSPLLEDRVEFGRYRNGCREMVNMLCLTQGPATRRSGFKFIFDLNSLGLDTANPLVRLIPFVFNEVQAYAMVFFKSTYAGKVKLVFATGEGLVTETAGSPTSCPPGTPHTPVAGTVVTLDMGAAFDIENFDWAQSGDEMYISASNHSPQVIKRHAHDCWELQTIAFTNAPTEWSATEGYPERVTLHQQRLVFGANLTGRQTVWMSKAGSFFDFGTSATPVASDAVTFTLDSGTQNKIQWLISQKSLVIGTLGNEWVVSGVNNYALTSENIRAQRYSNNGSEPMKPILAGFTTLFVERHGRTINEFVYDYNYDGYKSNPITVLAPHLTQEYPVVDWTFQQSPDSVLWCVRQDGDLLGLTYQREHKVVGWHRHTTEGAFKAVTSIPGNSREDELWIIAKRDVSGHPKYYLEKKGLTFIADTAEWGRFLDSYVVHQGPAVTLVSGLAHLEGEEVSILADGFVLPPKTVASGAVNLGGSYSHVVAGLPYESRLSPYSPEIQRKDGTSLGRTQRIIGLEVDFYKSLGGDYVQYDDYSDAREEEIIFRQPWDVVTEQVPLYTGMKRIDTMLGYDPVVRYSLVQRQPLPMTVRAIIDNIEVTE